MGWSNGCVLAKMEQWVGVQWYGMVVGYSGGVGVQWYGMVVGYSGGVGVQWYGMVVTVEG